MLCKACSRRSHKLTVWQCRSLKAVLGGEILPCNQLGSSQSLDQVFLFMLYFYSLNSMITWLTSDIVYMGSHLYHFLSGLKGPTASSLSTKNMFSKPKYVDYSNRSNTSQFLPPVAGPQKK